MVELLNHPLVVLFVLAPVGMGVTFVMNIWIDHAKKGRALKRLMNDSHVFEGARMIRVKGAGDVPVIDAKCYVSKLAFGRMEITVDDPSSDEHEAVYTFTGREFEQLVPVFDMRS